MNEQQENRYGVGEGKQEKERGATLRIMKKEMISPKSNKGQKFSDFCSLLTTTCVPNPGWYTVTFNTV